MNGLEQIQENIEKFICERKQTQRKIMEIEKTRAQLAERRNQKKKTKTNNDEEIKEIGKQISELGNQSQELQNELDSKFCATKVQINACIDNLIAEGIRKIRKINEEIQELEDKIENQKERNLKYQLQKQEFYVRFGRMPELSENAMQENKMQKEESKINMANIQAFNLQIEELKKEITELARVKRQFKNGNWDYIGKSENQAEEICIQEINVEEIETAEEIKIEEIGTVEELYIEEFKPIEELQVEEFEQIEELQVEKFEPIEELHVEEFKTETAQTEEGHAIQSTEEQTAIDPVEELAKLIVEQIVAEQTKENDVEKEGIEEEVITFEKGGEDDERIIIPLFGEKATISSIIIKIQNKELVYKAHMSDGNIVKIYPAKIGTENVLLRDNQNREECKKILINYAKTEYKMLDKDVINKIDPLICELLIECAQKYNYNAQELIYNYAMSFTGYENVDETQIPVITYNLSFIESSNLSRKEKTIINKICKNARKNYRINIIESFKGIRKIKYFLKRIFSVNNVKILPEAKY